MKKRTKITANLAALTVVTLTAFSFPVHAQTSDTQFPVQTPDPPLPKNSSIRLWLMDQSISKEVDGTFQNWNLKLDFRKLFPIGDPEGGLLLTGHLRHMFGTSPALMEKFIQDDGFYTNYNEISFGSGVRIPFQNFALIPQVHFKDMFALATNVNQHLVGLEPGLRLEYWFYPQVLKLAVDYGFTVPFFHFANKASSQELFSLSLNRVDLEMSYRLLNNLDLLVGFQWWQVPSELGSGGINSRALSAVSGFNVGLGGAF